VKAAAGSWPCCSWAAPAAAARRRSSGRTRSVPGPPVAAGVPAADADTAGHRRSPDVVAAARPVVVSDPLEPIKPAFFHSMTTVFLGPETVPGATAKSCRSRRGAGEKLLSNIARRSGS